MDAWPYAVVDNSQKPGTGNREQGTGNLGTPVFVSQGGQRSYKHPACAVFVKQGGKRSYECGLPRHRPWPCQGVQSAEYATISMTALLPRFRAAALLSRRASCRVRARLPGIPARRVRRPAAQIAFWRCHIRAARRDEAPRHGGTRQRGQAGRPLGTPVAVR